MVFLNSKSPLLFDRALFIIFTSVGCLSCFYLQSALNIPAFFASALVGFLGSFIPTSYLVNTKPLIACVYTGSFSAMCSLSFFTSSFDTIILGVLTGVYYITMARYFRGFGGKLGTIGFLSSLSFVLFKGLLWIFPITLFHFSQL